METLKLIWSMFVDAIDLLASRVTDWAERITEQLEFEELVAKVEAVVGKERAIELRDRALIHGPLNGVTPKEWLEWIYEEALGGES